MYKLTYCKDTNRIFIYIKGSLNKEDIENYIKEMILLIDRAKPGFTVLADSSESNIDFLENSGKLQIIRDYGVKKGFKNVATILSVKANDLHKIKPFPGIKNVFLSLEEAERFLDNLE